MNIKATLARLGNSMVDGRAARDLLLLPSPNIAVSEQGIGFAERVESDTINLVVGYSGSPNSQAALDLTLLIAYQTRLATRKQVIVQTVYVLEGIYHTQKQVFAAPSATPSTVANRRGSEYSSSTATVSERRTDKSVLSRRHTVNCVDARAAQIQWFEEADQVLWQARTFATEWRGSLNTHLRFGVPAAELSNVAQQEQADLMVVGCRSAEHPLIEQLKTVACCPVIGIPTLPELN